MPKERNFVPKCIQKNFARIVCNDEHFLHLIDSPITAPYVLSVNLYCCIKKLVACGGGEEGEGGGGGRRRRTRTRTRRRRRRRRWKKKNKNKKKKKEEES